MDSVVGCETWLPHRRMLARVFPRRVEFVDVASVPLPSLPPSLPLGLGLPFIPIYIKHIYVCAASGEHRAFFEAQQRREAEERQLREVEETQPMPTTIEGFKRHPQYMLDRHLGTISQIDKLGHLSMIMIYSHTFSHLSIPCPALTPPPPTGRWEVVYPRKVAGLFKGEAVYYRQHVHKGATVRQWKMQARLVRTSIVVSSHSILACWCLCIYV